MTKKELNAHIEKRYSECHKRSQGLSYGSFYDGYVDCYCEQQKLVTDLENKLANVSYQLEGREIELNELQKENEQLKNEVNGFKNTVKLNVETIKTLNDLTDVQDKQLTEAKEIIKKFSEFANLEVEYDPEHPQEHTDLWNELCKEAEQFLNSEVENG